MELLFWFILVVLTLKILAQISFFIYLLQLKEYRPDRLLEHLNRTHLSPSVLGKLSSIWLGLTLLAPISLKKLPRPTVKVLFLFFLSSLLVVLPSLTAYPTPFSPPILSIYYFGCLVLSPVFPLFSLVLLYPVNLAVRQTIYSLASYTVTKQSNLTVIGITGSYGKSTTKAFVAQLLAPDFPTLASPKNINTPLGVSLFILKKLKPSHRFLVVELSAYKQGEIKELCRIVHPHIGILTGIGNQHLALFGSQEKLIKAKAELLQALPKSGLALINIDHDYSDILSKYIGSKYYFYSTTKAASIFANTNQNNITARRQSTITLSLPDNTTHDYTTNLTVPHHIQNLLPALFLAHYYQVPQRLVTKTLLTLTVPDSTLQKKTGKHGGTLLLDLHNSTPEGVLAALDLLGRQPSTHKIVIMPCLIELGSKATEIHQAIGRSIAQNASLAIITTPDYFSILQDSSKGVDIRQLSDVHHISSLVKPLLGKQSTLLLSGKLPTVLVNTLK